MQKYEEEKERIVQETKNSLDAAVRKRQKLRMLLKEGFKVQIGYAGYNQAETMLLKLIGKSNSYLELLPSADNPEKMPWNLRCEFRYELSSNSSIPPYVIIDDFDNLIDRASMNNLSLEFKSDKYSSSYEFNINALLFKSSYFALILSYFLRYSKLFCFPSTGIDQLYKRKLITSKGNLISELKRINFDTSVINIANLPTGIDYSNIPGIGVPPCSFTYHYWNDVLGYVEDHVTFIRDTKDEYIAISNIEVEENEKVLIPLFEYPEMVLNERKRKIIEEIDNPPIWIYDGEKYQLKNYIILSNEAIN